MVHEKDLKVFEAESLKQFDAVILNNNCSRNPGRHLFFDLLKDKQKALELEQNLINFVAEGGGLVGIHGAIVIFNNSDPFSDVLGGSLTRSWWNCL